MPDAPSNAVREDEIELIKRARQHDMDAWERPVRAHQQVVFRLSYLLLGDAQEAEDNTQEAFIRAYRAMERFDSSRPLHPWLLRIAANLARNRMRSSGRYLAVIRRLIQHDRSIILVPKRSALDEKRLMSSGGPSKS